MSGDDEGSDKTVIIGDRIEVSRSSAGAPKEPIDLGDKTVFDSRQSREVREGTTWNASRDMQHGLAAPQDGSEVRVSGLPLADDSAVPAILGEGTVINNNYRIKSVLKSGGMGVVYKGVEVGTDDPVAIKVILPQLSEDEKAGLLFKREAKTLRQLQDDAIVQYYNYVYDSRIERYCLVMQFVNGQQLSDHLLENGPVAIRPVQKFLKRLAKGLQKAHTIGVYHRDLSPDNVMLPESSIEKAVLIDFGIAKSNVVPEGTTFGQFAGKMRYAAPEQFGAYNGVTGPESDVYGLALLVTAALRGKPLDMGSGSPAAAVAARSKIPDISDVPADMRPILRHMLEPDPQDRPRSMDEVIHLLENPEQIPRKYWDGPSPPAGYGRTETLAPGVRTGSLRPPVTASLPGLQVPLTSRLPTSNERPVPQETMPELGPRPRGGMIAALFVSGIVALGVLGYFASMAGLFPLNLGGAVVAEPPAPVAPDKTSDTREGFLAAWAKTPCLFVRRASRGENAGQLEGYSAGEGNFRGLTEAYSTRFGSGTSLKEFRVTSQQCPALELARRLQWTDVPLIDVTMRSASASRRDRIGGQIVEPTGRHVALLLVLQDGAVFKINGAMDLPVGTARNFEFSLGPGSDATQPSPALLVAIASSRPLVTLSSVGARRPHDAAALLPTVGVEIVEKLDGAGSVDLAYVGLLP